MWQESCVNKAFEHTVDLPVAHCLIYLIAWGRAVHVEVGTDCVPGERGGKLCRQVAAAGAGEAGKHEIPAVLTAPAALSPPPQHLGASALPGSSRFEALGLGPCYIAVGLLKKLSCLE